MSTIINAILLTIIVTIVAGSLTMYGLSAYHNYTIVEAQWDSQNECIDRFIRMGIERADIYRDGYTCNLKTYHSDPDNM